MSVTSVYLIALEIFQEVTVLKTQVHVYNFLQGDESSEKMM